ncbi:MAG: DUF192 domain-containing protein [Myxococcaceae bacterium]
MTYRVRNISRGTLVAEQVQKAESFWQRLFGLMGRPSLEPGEGLHIDPCQSIHMFFMRFAIDAAFVDANGHVVKTLTHFPPWRVSAFYGQAKGVLELPAGALQASQTHEGDRLTFEPLSALTPPKRGD